MQRDRPLQNSMILPDTGYSSTRRPSVPADYSLPLHVKKYQPPLDPHLVQHHNMLLQQARQFTHQSSFQEMLQIPRINDPIQELFDRVQRIGRVVDRHEIQLGTLLTEGELARRVLFEVRKNGVGGSSTADVGEQLLGMRLQIKDLQQQLSRAPKLPQLQQTIKKQVQLLSSKLGQPSSPSMPSIRSPDIQSLHQLIHKRDQHYQTILSNIQTQISMVKKNLSGHSLQMKISPITSASSIMLKYQELFKGKTNADKDMVLSQCNCVFYVDTYYIDNQGFLLDCHSRYIVDQKGKKIRLEDRHIGILKMQKLLH